MSKLRKFLLIGLTTLMLGCEVVAPALTALVISFGQDLIAAASVNHAPRYAQEMEALLIALARQSTGLQMQPILAQSGYQRPPPRYVVNQQQANQRQNTGYNQNNGPYAQPDDPYAQPNDPYAQPDDPYAQPNDPYAQSDDAYAQPNDPYAQPDDAYAQPNDPYAQPDDPYAQQNDPYAQANDPYATGSGSAMMRGIKPIELEATILTQRAGSTNLVAIEDGEILRDGGSNPASGDLLKVHFSANCACYVYVIGVDATGYVAQIYPDAEEGHANPVAPDQSFMVPQGPLDWWAMDAFKGVEQVFFVASFTPRDDIEQVLERMANIPRSAQPQDYQPVRKPVTIPVTRGLVKVKTQPVLVQVASGTQSITPTLFSTEETGGELVVTRWFMHE